MNPSAKERLAALSTRWRTAFAVVVILIGLASGWFYLQARQARDLSDPQRARARGEPIPVRTAQVTESQIEQVIGATGVTVPSQVGIVRLGFSQEQLMIAEPRLRSVLVHEGDHVKPGQLLLELDSREIDRLVKEREVALVAAEAEVKRVREQLLYNQRIRELDLASALASIEYRKEDLRGRKTECDAYKRLYVDKAASEFQLFTAQALLGQATFELSEAERHLERARAAVKVGILRDQEAEAKAVSDREQRAADLAVARHDQERHRIRAPNEGFVHFAGQVEPVAGSVVDVAGVLAEVLNLSPIYVHVDFPQERLDDLSLGQQVEVVLDSFPKETFVGQVVRIAPQVNSQLRVLPVLVELSNPKQRIKSGISGFTRFRTTRTAVTVPSTAVLEHGSKSMVFCVKEGRAHIREIRTGHQLENGVVEVRSGVAPGEEVVIYHGFYRHANNLSEAEGYLKDNDRVDVNWRQWAGRK